jgi:hypothetical protein
LATTRSIRQARIEIVELDLHRILLRRRRRAAGQRQCRRAPAPADRRNALASSRLVDQFHAPILRPGRLVIAFDRRPLGAEAHRGELRLGDALQHQRAPHRLRAPLAEADVVFARAALVGVALELELDVARMRWSDCAHCAVTIGKLGLDVGFVEVEVNDRRAEPPAGIALPAPCRSPPPSGAPLVEAPCAVRVEPEPPEPAARVGGSTVGGFLGQPASSAAAANKQAIDIFFMNSPSDAAVEPKPTGD